MKRSILPAPATPVAVAKPGETECERTDDPVRMYLREMGSIEILSRQGEIEIAMRIEKGREIYDRRDMRESADRAGHRSVAG